MRYLIKREFRYGKNYMGRSAERISTVTKERILLYGFKTLEGAENAVERAKAYMPNVKFTIVPFPVD